MVLVQAHPARADDGGPLDMLRARRAETEAELPRSLALSSFTMLTLVVIFLLAQIALRGGTTDKPTSDGPPLDFPIHEVFKIAPIPGGFVQPIVPPVGPSEIIPVDQDVVRPVDPSALTPHQTLPGTGEGDVTGKVGPGIVGGTGDGSGEVEPPAKGFTYLEELPVLVTRVLPLYPAIARDAGMEGRVLVRMLVGVDGRVRRAEVEESMAMFDDAALVAARQWVFTPAKTDGHAVMAWVRVPMVFKLH